MGKGLEPRTYVDLLERYRFCIHLIGMDASALGSQRWEVANSLHSPLAVYPRLMLWIIQISGRVYCIPNFNDRAIVSSHST